jgi:hypothetical protein
MSTPFSEDVAFVFTLVKSYPGIKGRHLMQETNFGQNRAIDAVKELVLRNLVYVDLSGYPDFSECRFYPR